MIGNALNILSGKKNTNPYMNERDNEDYGKKKLIKHPNALMFGLTGLALNPIKTVAQNINNPAIYPHGILPPQMSKEQLSAAMKLGALGLFNPSKDSSSAMGLLKSIRKGPLALAGLGVAMGYGMDKIQQKSIEYEKKRFETIKSMIKELLKKKGVSEQDAEMASETQTDIIRLTNPSLYYGSETKMDLIKSFVEDRIEKGQQKVAIYKEAIFEKAGC